MPVLMTLDSLTLVLFLLFALFLIVTYLILKIVARLIIVASVSIALPIVLYYIGVLQTLSLNTILIFGVVGTITYFVWLISHKIVDFFWGFGRFFHRHGAKKPITRKKVRIEREEEEE